ncbi:unnamed protein product [Closterium sp. Yama58-4]|nr:unnamed protein product [Closterium sp. Yama58-4]
MRAAPHLKPWCNAEEFGAERIHSVGQVGTVDAEVVVQHGQPGQAHVYRQHAGAAGRERGVQFKVGGAE